MTHRIKPQDKYVRISMKDILAQFGRSAEKIELWSDVESFEFSRPKSSSDRT